LGGVFDEVPGVKYAGGDDNRYRPTVSQDVTEL